MCAGSCGAIPHVGEAPITAGGEDGGAVIRDAAGMDAIPADLIEAASSFVWLISPIGLLVLVGLCGLVLTGLPARMILAVETYLARRGMEARRRRPPDDSESVATVAYLERAA